jgi:hypothetical protein
LAVVRGDSEITVVNEAVEETVRDHSNREWVARLDTGREHETRFISEYMTLNKCTESAARSVYIHVFPHWPRTTTS